MPHGSHIHIQDEATSSVDVETDAKVQRTIQTEFASSTLLCIAHRLNTIGTSLSSRTHNYVAHVHPRSVYYDRILVMDQGKVAEFDTPLNLYDKEGSIFRSLCNEANLARADILRIRASVAGPVSVPASAPVSVPGSATASVAEKASERE